MHHINDDGEAKICSAATPENCKFYGGEDNPRHFENPKEAQQYSERFLADKHGELAKRRRYSFIKEFKEKEEQFNKDFNGFPNRFFTADLRGKIIPPLDTPMTDKEVYMLSYRVGLHSSEVVRRLAQAASTPQDANITEEQLIEIAEQNGLTKIQEVHSRTTLTSFKTERLWTAETAVKGQTVVITSQSAPSKNFKKYRFTYMPPEGVNAKIFYSVDVRTLVGAARVQRRTGTEVAQIAFNDKVLSGKTDTPEILSKTVSVRQHLQGAQLIIAVNRLEEDQNEGVNFKAQKKFFSEQQKSSATIWMDKKNQDDDHQRMAKNSPLAKTFSKIEVDNDVDEESFKDFEQAYLDVKDKLPPIPADRAPELRIRKLGRHRADGAYVPHANTIAIDVNTSGAFIHEYGHYLDIAVEGNASLSKEYKEIVGEYRRSLRLPDNIPESKREYYSTPTETLARGFEIYAHEKLGVNNRLLDAEKFDKFDYLPFTQNPELKSKLFSFFDTTFNK